jgi:WD40 repeat protein
MEVSDELLEDSTKQCVKVLEGHKKAVREIAYAPNQKILISCGFDFEVFVWNPYLKENIMSLKGHDQPLVGVNVLPGVNCFITADAKGTVKVWSILDYSC